jgi:hypothetical protein
MPMDVIDHMDFYRSRLDPNASKWPNDVEMGYEEAIMLDLREAEANRDPEVLAMLERARWVRQARSAGADTAETHQTLKDAEQELKNFVEGYARTRELDPVTLLNCINEMATREELGPA